MSTGPASRRAAWLLLMVTLVATGPAVAEDAGARPFQFTDETLEDNVHQRVRLLGLLDLTPIAERNAKLVELSGLAWDEDEGLLYAVSDRGHLVHLRPQFRNGRLVDVRALADFALRDARGRPLAHKAADAEGRDAPGRERYPRRHGVAGVLRAPAPAPGAWSRRSLAPRGADAGATDQARCLPQRQQGHRGDHLAPEAGLLAGSEWPATATPQDKLTLFTSSEASISMPRLAARNAGLVAVEALPDGRLLTLERAHSWLTLTVIIALRLSDQPVLDGGDTPSQEVARFDSGLGWRVDNFEGLAHHRDGRFFMVSDDNGSALQRTLLLYFELVQAP